MLVLSLFPGGGMLDHAFELEGFCVVRGPDPLWGGDVRRFHPPAGVFDGIIGGPPCQRFSPIGNVNRARYGDDAVMPDLIPEFTRCLKEAKPHWYLMECSTFAYGPDPDAYTFELDVAWFDQAQERRRAFWCSHPIHRKLQMPALVGPDAGLERTVCSKGSVDWKGSRRRAKQRSLEEMLRLQGFPADWLEHQPWTMQAKRRIVGNGVPLPMGRQLARAIRLAVEGA